jgi:hypothetical protein
MSGNQEKNSIFVAPYFTNYVTFQPCTFLGRRAT